MNPTSQRQNNRLQLAALLRWVIITVFLGVAGLSYLYLKNQLFVLGGHRHAMEQELGELVSQNSVLGSRVSNLISYNALQKHLEGGTLKLIPINDHTVVHVHSSDNMRSTVADERIGNQYQTVAHDTIVRR